MFILRFLQLVIISIPVGLFLWLANQWFVPSGVFKISHVVGESSSFIDELRPETRVSSVEKNEQGQSVQSVFGDPVFFFLHPHRVFSNMNLEVWFQNEGLPLIELGALSKIHPEVYTLTPLQNRIIDDSSWNRLEKNGLVLLQRQQIYQSVDDFFANPPERNQVAVYRTSFESPFRLPSYQSTNKKQMIDVSLRGHHEFKTYIKNETLLFRVSFMDMNRDEGEDVTRLTVFNESGQPVAEARAADDGNASQDAHVVDGLRTIDLRTDGLPEGVYKVVMDAPRDIFFRKVETSQQKMVFLNTLFIGDEIGYREPGQGATFYTQSQRLRFQTRHAEGVQTVLAGDASVTIAQPYEWYTLSLDGQGVRSVTLPAGDVEIVTEGGVSFSKEQFFEPDPPSLNAYASLDQMGVDYVLARYTSPHKEGEWLVANVEFPVSLLYTDNQTWKFSFSTPGIEELDARFKIHQINALLYR
ncbi:hypothetical protein HYV70_00840 [Candidatus Uhrbacteria bacterium]|nr:hypothetical protein [Candidatus Uhrbacteria bacterium]